MVQFFLAIIWDKHSNWNRNPSVVFHSIWFSKNWHWKSIVSANYNGFQ